MLNLGSLPGVWTEHMLMVAPHGLSKSCDHCPNITYWRNAAVQPQEFLSMELSLEFAESSLGGAILIDDVSLENVPGPGWLGVLGLGALGGWRRRR